MTKRNIEYYETKLEALEEAYRKEKTSTKNPQILHNLSSNICNTKKNIAKIKQVSVRDIDNYHQIAEMKRALMAYSKTLDKSRGLPIRNFVRNYKNDRDYEILVQLFETLKEKM